MTGIIIAVVFIIVIVPKIKISKEFDENTISLSESSSLKGILCLAVFFNHFTGWYTDLDPIMYLFVHCGSQVVAVFFFLSAYGIGKKYKDSTIGNEYLIKRYTSLFIPYWICEAVYCIVSVSADIPIKVDVNPKNIFVAALGIVDKSEIVENAWFVTVIALMYLIYFISYKFAPKINNTAKIWFLFILLSVLTRGRWLSTSIAFPIGTLIAEYEAKIKRIFREKSILSIILLLLAFGLGVSLKYIGKSRNENVVIMELSDTVTSIIFPIIVYYLIHYVKIGNSVTGFLSGISYEVYLIHGLMIRISYRIWGPDNKIMFCLTALGMTVIAAYVINLIYKPIKKQIFRKKI